MWITRVSIKNPVFATMVMVGIVVLGLFSYARLRVEQMPDVTLPFVDIETVGFWARWSELVARRRVAFGVVGAVIVVASIFFATQVGNLVGELLDLDRKLRAVAIV